MGDSGKLRFYELDHESKMRLLKTHSHTSNRLAMEPGTREEKQLKETQTLQQGKRYPSKTWRVPPVWRGGAEKALEPVACRRCGGGGQERLYGKPTSEKGTMAIAAFVVLYFCVLIINNRYQVPINSGTFASAILLL